MATLTGKKVAIITENGFEEVELTSPKKALEEAGAEVKIVSMQKGKVKAWDHDHWSIELPVDYIIDRCQPGRFRRLNDTWRRTQSRSDACSRRICGFYPAFPFRR